eukprot:scaffold97530_cov37-Phaeocystis_antarctica.AAC.2
MGHRPPLRAPRATEARGARHPRGAAAGLGQAPPPLTLTLTLTLTLSLSLTLTLTLTLSLTRQAPPPLAGGGLHAALLRRLCRGGDGPGRLPADLSPTWVRFAASVPLILLADTACVRTFDCNGDLIATLQPDAGYDLRLASRGACAYSDAARVALLCMQTAKNGVRDKWGRASSSILDGLEAAAAEAEAAAAGEEPLVSPTSTPASTTRLARYSCPLTLLSVYPAMAEQLGAEPSNSELRQVLARFTHAQRLDEARLAADL